MTFPLPDLSPSMAVFFLSTAVCVFSVLFFLRYVLVQGGSSVQKRFDTIPKAFQNPVGERRALIRKQNDWKQFTVFNKLPAPVNLPLLFEQAGMTCNLGIWLMTVGALAATGGFLAWFMTGKIPQSAACGGVLLLVPYLYVLYKKKQRVHQFETQLAQSLEIIARSLRAGHPFLAGLQMVNQEMPDPISTEFGRVCQEQQVGMTIEESLLAMTRRVPLIDLRFFVIAIIIHRQIGGDLGEVLDNLSRVIRDRFRVLGQVKALTAEGRLSGWILCALPVFIFFMLSLINPEYIGTLTGTDIGLKLIYTAVFFQVMGMLCIRKIVNIKV
ncbi:MAG TPA: type II secretion system F family protein [bacterium]|nr:type II secretion system F family protein [Candidatus Omnitrophota bacterium]HOJ62220.1 type II secretion system F family protein [bacterium]HOL95295.1 type II secretion system F family protein [bacterium]HPP02784.1 type II secretion system F family protein [bacterium]HXK95545.1 type II secretion system F family protein [bacterium]